ncbi:MAG: LysR family transcriptional regulator [Pseudomonadota bacterium]
MAQRRIPSLNWLRVFDAAARTENFTRAGEALNMSAAAVSQQIKALEAHLGTQLFDRGPRSVSLTGAGRAFLPVVRQALLSVETTAASLFSRDRYATVTIEATLVFAASWLAERLPAFQVAHPSIHVHVMGAFHDASVDREGVDLAIAYGGISQDEADSDLLFGERIYPVAPPATASAITAPDHLIRHRLLEISTHRTSWLRLLETTPDLDMSEAEFCFTDTTVVALAMAAAGHGIGLARAPASDYLERLYGLERCLPGLEVESGQAYFLVSRAAASLTPAAQQFRSWLLDETARWR